MRKLIILLLITFSFAAQAQDWHGVVQGDTTYYNAKDYGGELNVIWIDSARAIGSDSIFYFFPSFSLKNDTTICYDSLGATWLGKHFIRKNNGDEIYFDRWEDSLLIKTKALLLETWAMYTDTAGLTYNATVSAISTAFIDGVQDSVKEINIQVFNGSIAVTNHPLFNYKLNISKAHGFMNTIAFFVLSNGVAGLHDYTRVPHEVNDYFFSFKPFAFYQTGNAKLTRTINNLGGQYVPPDIYYYYDTIISAQMISPNLLAVHKEEYEIQHHYYQTIIPNYADSVITTLVTKYDTFNVANSPTLPTTSLFQSTVLPNVSYAHNITNNDKYFFKSYYLKELDSCSFKWQLYIDNHNEMYYTNPTDTCWEFHGNLAAYVQHVETKILFGNIEEKFNTYSIPVSTTGNNLKRDLLYYKQDSCIFGNPFNIFALSNNIPLKIGSQIKAYPNPTHDIIYIETELDFKNISLLTITGQKINTLIKNNQVEVSNISNGLYLLKIETEEGTAFKKIMVQH